MMTISGKTETQLAEMEKNSPQDFAELKATAEAFPSGFDDDGLPLGWGSMKLKEVINEYVDNRGKTPPIEKEGIPLLEVKDMLENSIYPKTKTAKYISEDTYNNWLRKELQPLDIIISTVGTIGRINLIPNNKKLAVAQNVLGLRFNDSIAKQIFMFYQMKSHKFNFDLNARLVETVQKSIKRKDLETIPLLIPSIEIQEKFELFISPFILKQDNSENEYLEQTRDTLLPKLLSGELSTPKVLEEKNYEW